MIYIEVSYYEMFLIVLGLLTVLVMGFWCGVEMTEEKYEKFIRDGFGQEYDKYIQRKRLIRK